MLIFRVTVHVQASTTNEIVLYSSRFQILLLKSELHRPRRICTSYFFTFLDTQVPTALHTSEVTPRAGAMGCRRPSTSERCPS